MGNQPIEYCSVCVTIETMLVNNNGVMQQTDYYGDPQGVVNVPPPRTHMPSHGNRYTDYHNNIPQGIHHHHYYGNNYHGYYGPRANHSHIQDCPCPHRPVQESFLHQILTGKGYKNDCLYVTRPIKQEYMYHEYNCCYPPISYSNHYVHQYSHGH